MSDTPKQPDHLIDKAADGLDDPFDDPWGTNHLFEQLWSCAEMLEANFDEQIAGAPAGLLEERREYAIALGYSLAYIKRELEITE